MFLLLILHVPILIEILILYRRLGPPTEKWERLESEDKHGYKNVQGSTKQIDEETMTD